MTGPAANGTRPGTPVIFPALHAQRLAPVPGKKPGWQQASHVLASHRGWLAAIPVILVNIVAFSAQLGFWHAHLRVPAQAVLTAVALETIAVYLAWQAHLALLADDSALRLRLSAYGMALIIGALNYSHFDGPHWQPTVAAVTFGMMSVISPWLWSVHSRRVSRDALKAHEPPLIEPHAVRLGMTRWTWHPLRCPQVMWHATWEGENDPAKAIALLTAAPVAETARNTGSTAVDEDAARQARALYRASGQTIGRRTLGQKFGYSGQWGADRIKEVKAGMP